MNPMASLCTMPRVKRVNGERVVLGEINPVSGGGQELNKRDPHLSVHPDNLYVVKNKVSGCNSHISAVLI